MSLDNRSRAGAQVSCARVIAEPGPDPQHVIETCFGERSHGRPAQKKSGVIGSDRLHRGLLQHDLRQPHTVGIRSLAAPCAPGQYAGMPVVPGQQVHRVRPVDFLPPRQADCYGHGADHGTWGTGMTKSLRSFPRPLSELLGATLGDALKAQGFASTEIISRWRDIVGSGIAAHSEPLKINWPRPFGGPAAGPAPLGLRGGGPAGVEIPPLPGRILRRVNRFFGWQAIGRIALRQAPLKHRKKVVPPSPDPVLAAQIAETLPDVKDENLRQALARLGAAIKRN